MITKILLRAAAALSFAGLIACSLLSPEPTLVATHQELGAGRPMCSECHENETMKHAQKPYSALDHTPTFVKDHKYAANQSITTCATCHSQSSCSDCHAGKGVISPALKLAERPDRMSPHRGGYMALHRVEGKTDPTSCFKCHGRANNQLCMTCHR